MADRSRHGREFGSQGISKDVQIWAGREVRDDGDRELAHVGEHGEGHCDVSDRNRQGVEAFLGMIDTAQS